MLEGKLDLETNEAEATKMGTQGRKKKLSFKDKYKEKGLLLTHHFTGAERRPHKNHKKVRENVLKKKITVPKR